MINNQFNITLFGIVLIGIVFLLCTNNKKIYGKEPKLIKKIESDININLSPTLTTYSKAELSNTTFSEDIIGWIENSRNNINISEYPPCFNDSVKIIYQIFKSNNLISQHKILLEAISILLCHLNSNSTNQCIQNNINVRVDDLGNLGYERNDLTYESIVKLYAQKDLSPVVFELLLRATTIIENEIKKINDSNVLNSQTKINLRNLINQFYSNTFDKITC